MSAQLSVSLVVQAVGFAAVTSIPMLLGVRATADHPDDRTSAARWSRVRGRAARRSGQAGAGTLLPLPASAPGGRGAISRQLTTAPAGPIQRRQVRG